MSKTQTLEQAAKKYAARVEYRKRLTRLMAQNVCFVGEEAEYDGYMRMTYPGHPRCYQNERLAKEKWCSRCRRKERLYEARRSAYAAERNALRGLLNAARRES